MNISLPLEEINLLLDALHARCAGDTAVGDIAWSHEEEVAALRILDKLIDAASRAKKGTV